MFVDEREDGQVTSKKKKKIEVQDDRTQQKN
jgi:hypothetical protein